MAPRVGVKRGPYAWKPGCQKGRPRTLLLKEVVWTAQLAELLGYIAGDGCVADHSVSLLFNSEEVDLEPKYLQAMRDCFGQEPPKRCVRGSVVVYYYGSKDLRDWCKKVGVKDQVPERVMEDPELGCAYARVCSQQTGLSLSVKGRLR